MTEKKIPTGRTESPGATKPTPAPGCVFESETNPYAGNCEASWWWVEYKIVKEGDE